MFPTRSMSPFFTPQGYSPTSVCVPYRGSGHSAASSDLYGSHCVRRRNGTNSLVLSLNCLADPNTLAEQFGYINLAVQTIAHAQVSAHRDAIPLVDHHDDSAAAKTSKKIPKVERMEARPYLRTTILWQNKSVITVDRIRRYLDCVTVTFLDTRRLITKPLIADHTVTHDRNNTMFLRRESLREPFREVPAFAHSRKVGRCSGSDQNSLIPKAALVTAVREIFKAMKAVHIQRTERNPAEHLLKQYKRRTCLHVTFFPSDFDRNSFRHLRDVRQRDHVIRLRSTERRVKINYNLVGPKHGTQRLSGNSIRAQSDHLRTAYRCFQIRRQTCANMRNFIFNELAVRSAEPT